MAAVTMEPIGRGKQYVTSLTEKCSRGPMRAPMPPGTGSPSVGSGLGHTLTRKMRRSRSLACRVTFLARPGDERHV